MKNEKKTLIILFIKNDGGNTVLFIHKNKQKLLLLLFFFRSHSSLFKKVFVSNICLTLNMFYLFFAQMLEPFLHFQIFLHRLWISGIKIKLILPILNFEQKP